MSLTKRELLRVRYVRVGHAICQSCKLLLTENRGNPLLLAAPDLLCNQLLEVDVAGWNLQGEGGGGGGGSWQGVILVRGEGVLIYSWEWTHEC